MNSEMQMLSAMVDELAVLNANLKVMNDRASEIKLMLAGSGLPVVESDIYRAAISFVEPKASPDWKVIAQKLEPSRQLIAANMKPAPAGYYKVAISDKNVGV